MKIKSLFLSITVICFLIVGCEKEPEPVPEPEEPEIVDDGVRAPQHGGFLIMLGDEAGYLELVVDSVEGKLTAYVLDNRAKDPVGLGQSSFDLELVRRVVMGKGVEVITYNLSLSSANSDNSAFSVQDDRLKDIDSFQGNIGTISLNGQDFNNISFSFPQ